MKLNSKAYLQTSVKKKTIPYTYSVTHKSSGIHYYGSRICNGCSPDDLFKRYFTSCKIIHDLVKKEGTDGFLIKIRKTFKNAKDCIEHENKFLKRVDAKNNPKFFNRHNETILVNTKFNWITNGNITIKWPIEKVVPDGFKIGLHYKPSKTKGKIWIHNPTTKEFSMICRDEPIPNGFLRGRGEEFYIKHSNTLKNKRMKVITNGSENKYISSDEQIPDGWKYGKTFRSKENLGKRSYEYIWITNGIEEAHLKIGEPIPDGWKLGRCFPKIQKTFRIS